MNPPLQKRSVLHVVPGLGIHGALGGADRVAATLVQGLEASSGYAPRLCAIRAPDPVNPRHGLTVPVNFLGYAGADQDWEMAGACTAKLRRAIREAKPGVVHSHLWPAAFATGLALLGMDVPHVIHIHDQRAWLASARLRHKLRRASQRLVMHFTRPTLVACSQATARFTASHFGLAPAGLRVLWSGIDCRALAALPETAAAADRPLTFGLAARIAPEKGVGDMIQACGILAREGASYRVRIAGAGPARREYEQAAREMGIADRVEFIGPVEDMVGFYADIDIFVLPSWSEGLPLSILEAMAAARPVVATSVSGIPEAVTDGTDGLLVPPSDPASLAGAMRKLIRTPSLIREMGQRARARILRDFSAERMVRQCAGLYDEILAARNR